MSRRGFTLIEMLMVVIVAAILAAVALPTYRKTVEQSHWRTGRNLLQAIYSGERVYWTTNGTYVDPGAVWSTIYMDPPNTADITFGVGGVSAVAFVATATRVGGGPCGGRTITINQARTLGGTWPQNGAC